MKPWPVPSLARKKGTWLEDSGKSDTGWSRNISFEGQLGVRLVDKTANPVDAYLYLGPPELLLVRDPSFYGFGDKDYITELHRRQAAAGSARIDPRADPDMVASRKAKFSSAAPDRRGNLFFLNRDVRSRRAHEQRLDLPRTKQRLANSRTQNPSKTRHR